MGKKFLAILLCITMTASIFTGCGNAENNVTESKDWSKAYDSYFDNVSLSENIKISTEIADGNLSYTTTVARAGEIAGMTMDFGKNLLEAYVDTSNIYIHAKTKDGDIWQKTSIESMDKVDEIAGIETTSPLKDLIKSLSNVTYAEETANLGVTYDVLKAQIPWGDDGLRYYMEEDGTAIGIYEGVTYTNKAGEEISYDSLPATTEVKISINRNTQEIEKVEGCINGYNSVFHVEECTEIKIPDQATKAPNVEAEAITMTILGVIFTALEE